MGVPLSLEHSMSILESAVATQQMDYAGRVLLEMKQSPPYEPAYCMYIKGCSLVGDMASAVDAWESFKRQNGIPSLLMHNTLARGFGKAGMFEEAVEVVGSMRKCGQYPNESTFNALLDAAVDHADVAAAIRVFSLMSEASMRVSPMRASRYSVNRRILVNYNAH